MKYLLDTHVLLWYFEGNEKLPAKIREDVLFTPKHQIFVCMASLWEVAIKISIGKLSIASGFTQFHQFVVDNEFELVTMDKRHLEGLLALPLLHRDPFDRLLIATAKAEGMTIVTADENIHRYDVLWQW